MSTESTGKRIGDYEILGELGKGGMGRVYKVRNVISDRVEAMKVLLPDLAGQKDLADRFLREIKMLASLDHPNIAALRTAFTAENQLVMIMEYVEGETLAARVERGPVPVPDALKYMDDALSALSYAHKQNIIHRDVKPSNMMVTPQGLLKLMDFGIARSGNDKNLTVTGTALGSLNYMSPEQIQGGAVDARSDIYSLGIALYEIVTGKQPFKRDSDFAIMAAHMKEMPQHPIELRPDMPQGLNDIILMAIAKDPNQRFQTAEAFRGAINSVRENLSGQPVATASIAPPAWTPTPAVAQPAASATPPKIPTQQIPPPQPTAHQMPPTVIVAAQTSSHRGLYITLGAVIVLVVLVAAGFTVPRYLKARASSGQSALPSQPQQISNQPPAAAAPPANATRQHANRFSSQSLHRKLSRHASPNASGRPSRSSQIRRSSEAETRASSSHNSRQSSRRRRKSPSRSPSPRRRTSPPSSPSRSRTSNGSTQRPRRLSKSQPSHSKKFHVPTRPRPKRRHGSRRSPSRHGYAKSPTSPRRPKSRSRPAVHKASRRRSRKARKIHGPLSCRKARRCVARG